MTEHQPAAKALAERIRMLNDAFRHGCATGSLVMTSGVIARGGDFQEAALLAVRSFDDFTPDNDPYGEHDFGSAVIESVRLFFKIDYYNATFDGHSPNPADDSVTHRVLTLMLAEEY
jgi:hypothetical protein